MRAYTFVCLSGLTRTTGKPLCTWDMRVTCVYKSGCRDVYIKKTWQQLHISGCPSTNKAPYMYVQAPSLSCQAHPGSLKVCWHVPWLGQRHSTLRPYNFQLSDSVRLKSENQLRWVISPAPHNLVRRIRFSRIKISGRWFYIFVLDNNYLKQILPSADSENRSSSHNERTHNEFSASALLRI